MMGIFTIIEMLHKNDLQWVCWPMEATFIKNRQTIFIEYNMWCIWGLLGLATCLAAIFLTEPLVLHFPANVSHIGIVVVASSQHHYC